MLSVLTYVFKQSKTCARLIDSQTIILNYIIITQPFHSLSLYCSSPPPPFASATAASGLATIKMTESPRKKSLLI